MNGEAASDKLGRLVGMAREKSAETGDGLWAKARAVGRRKVPSEGSSTSRASPRSPGDARVENERVERTIDVDLSDALARAESAEAEVVRLQTELAHKEEILAEARIALRTARLALRDHLRITQQ